MLPEPPRDPVLVLNGDLVTQMNVHLFLEAHQRLGVRATMAVRRYFHAMPFGCVEVREERVTRLVEKPVLEKMIKQIQLMKFKLIYPRWEKLEGQTIFNLPPHGPIVMAAALPENVEIEFTDENVEDLVIDDSPDFVGISMMLTTQVKRGWAIADRSGL